MTYSVPLKAKLKLYCTDPDHEDFDTVIQDEIGKVFMHVLEDAGVYKRTPEGQKAFDRFVTSLN